MAKQTEFTKPIRVELDAGAKFVSPKVMYEACDIIEAQAEVIEAWEKVNVMSCPELLIARKRKNALFRQLQGDGYMQAEGNEIDAAVCAESVCECGHLGTKYYAFRKRMNLGCYRAVSVCPKCGKAEEF